MNFILFISLVLVSAQINQLPPEEEISELVFVGEKAFFLTESKRFFGFIEIETGYYSMQQELKEEEEVLRVDEDQEFFALRKEANKVLIFNLRDVNIQEISVQIRFKQQKIVDILQKDGQFYILTNKDLRRYNENIEVIDNSKNVLTSCRRKQLFLKFFDCGDSIRVVLIQEQQICVRIVKKGQKSKQKCLFNITSETTEISKVEKGILLQTEAINYVIMDNLKVFSFRGKVTQVNNGFVIFGDEFKSVQLQKPRSVDGLEVHGSSDENQFFLKQTESNGVVLTRNEVVVEEVGEERPKRAWIGAKQQGMFALVMQFDDKKPSFLNVDCSDKKKTKKDENDQSDL